MSLATSPAACPPMPSATRNREPRLASGQGGCGSAQLTQSSLSGRRQPSSLSVLTVSAEGWKAASASAAFLQRPSKLIIICVNPKLDHVVFVAFALQNEIDVRTHRRREFIRSGGDLLTILPNLGPNGLGADIHSGCA